MAPAGYVFKRSQPDDAWIGNARILMKDGKAFVSSAAIKGTPLYLAGLDAGDAIIKMDENNIVNEQSISDFLKTKNPGEIVNITFERDGKILSTTIKLANNPAVEVVAFEKVGLTITSEIEAFRKSWLNSKASN